MNEGGGFMDYPMVNNCLSYTYNEDNDTYTVKNIDTDEEITVNSSTVFFINKLDGKTNPFDLLPSVEPSLVVEYLDRLRDAELIRDSRLNKEVFGTWIYALFIPKDRTNRMRPARIICYFLSWLLVLSWIPAMAFGIYSFINGEIDTEHYVAGMVFGTLIGALLHELSHALSACAYGAPIYEIGVMITHYVLLGAYVKMDQEPVKKKLRRAQIDAAGVEMNMLLTGVFLFLASLNEVTCGLMFGAALANGFMGLINLFFIWGLDGGNILGNLLGDDNFVGNSFLTILGSEERRILKKQGISGYALILATLIIGISQISLIVIVVANFLGILVWIR